LRERQFEMVSGASFDGQSTPASLAPVSHACRTPNRARAKPVSLNGIAFQPRSDVTARVLHRVSRDTGRRAWRVHQVRGSSRLLYRRSNLRFRIVGYSGGWHDTRIQGFPLFGPSHDTVRRHRRGAGF
jgi:hypothetical protein